MAGMDRGEPVTRLSVAEMVAIRGMYLSGIKLKDIAAKVGRPKMEVHRALLKNGVYHLTGGGRR
jgi:hypothetical protein